MAVFSVPLSSGTKCFLLGSREKGEWRPVRTEHVGHRQTSEAAGAGKGREFGRKVCLRRG